MGGAEGGTVPHHTKKGEARPRETNIEFGKIAWRAPAPVVPNGAPLTEVNRLDGHCTPLPAELQNELTALRTELQDLLLQGSSADENRLGYVLRTLEDKLEQARILTQAGGSDDGCERLCSRLESVAETLTQEAGIPCPVTIDFFSDDKGQPNPTSILPLAPRQLTLVDSIVREAVRNIERHAHASTATISVSARADTLHITITDDGWGLCPAAVHSPGRKGLSRMREDARALHGRLVIEAPDGGGTRIALSFPRTAHPAEAGVMGAMPSGVAG